MFCLITYHKQSVMEKLSCTFQMAHNPVGQILCCKQMELETLGGETGVVLEMASVGRTPPCVAASLVFWKDLGQSSLLCERRQC